MQWLTQFFVEERRYSEKEANSIIARHHPDLATLRRELICARLLDRAKGSYWRVA